MGFTMPLGRVWTGFATLAAAVTLVLLVALLGGLMVQSQETSGWQRRLDTAGLVTKQLKTHLALTLKGEVLDPETVPNLPGGVEVSLINLSGRLDLNAVSLDVLRSPALSVFLKDLDEFQAFRLGGPYPRRESYREWVNGEALDALFRTVSFLNPNTVDPAMLERYVVSRTGSASLASDIRSRVESFRSRRQPWTPGELEFLLGTDKNLLSPLIGLEGDLDVNQAPDAVLDAIVASRRWDIPGLEAKMVLIKQERGGHSLTEERLRNLLGVEVNHPLLGYLGTRSRFFAVEYADGRSRWSAQIVDDSPDDRAHWRVVLWEGPW